MSIGVSRVNPPLLRAYGFSEETIEAVLGIERTADSLVAHLAEQAARETVQVGKLTADIAAMTESIAAQTETLRELTALVDAGVLA